MGIAMLFVFFALMGCVVAPQWLIGCLVIALIGLWVEAKS